mgnify:CR=1 FL=1
MCSLQNVRDCQISQRWLHDGQIFTDKGLGGTEGWLRSFEPMKHSLLEKGWLSKGMRYVSQKPDVLLTKMINPMDVLGIGANMVKSLRYWLQAVA